MQLVWYFELKIIYIKERLEKYGNHPNSEWLVQTTEKISSYYEKNGFKVNNDVFLSIPCKLFSHT